MAVFWLPRALGAQRRGVDDPEVRALDAAKRVQVVVVPARIGAPESLSSACSKSTDESGVVESTTVIGMPIGPPSQSPDPKSAWRRRLAPIEFTIVPESSRTGSL